MAKSNRTCHTCMEQYYFCPACPSSDKKEAYYNMFCSERCSKIFKLLTDENFKHITTLQCKDQLLELNVSTNENLKEGVKKHVQRVLCCEEPIVNVDIAKEEVAEEVVETTIKPEEVDNIADESVDEVVIESVVKSETVVEENVKKMNYIPKKNRKKQNSEVD